MKNFKKVYAMVASAIVCAVMFVSCNVFSSGLDFRKPEDMKTLSGMLQKAIKKDMVVQEVMFYQTNSSSFSFSNDKAQILYVDSVDNKKAHGIDVNLKTGEVTVNDLIENQHEGGIALKGVKLDNFDFSTISTAVNAAIAELLKENITASGLGGFSVNFNSGDIAKANFSFSLQHQTGSQMMGRRIQYKYDEYEFTADKNGNLITE